MDDFLILTVAGIVIVVAILLAVLAFLVIKEKNQNKVKTAGNKANDEVEEKRAKKSLFKFMEFDTVEDNMIVQDGGQRYLMVIECKGVNYDLLSNVEKTAVEQGFIGFLNTLKFEIQLYVQTRKVNLAQSTMKYRERLRLIELDMREEEQRYQDMQRDGNYTRDEILKELKEVTKKRNLYEYGRDIIENTEQMSEDSDLTTKEYYIVVPYYTDEITSAGDYDKREIGSMAFSELYTRATSLVNALTECDVRGKILTSQELIELLFISYNREQHDTYDFEEYIGQSGFNSFYSVTEDVLEKRMAALDEEIAQKGAEKALEAFRRSNRREERMRQAVEEREKRRKEYINRVAEQAIETEVSQLGHVAVRHAKEELEEMIREEEKHEQKKKEGNKEDNISKEDIEVIQNQTEEAKENEAPKKQKKVLTPEERERRLRILKKRKLMAMKEAKKNGEN